MDIFFPFALSLPPLSTPVPQCQPTKTTQMSICEFFVVGTIYLCSWIMANIMHGLALFFISLVFLWAMWMQGQRNC